VLTRKVLAALVPALILAALACGVAAGADPEVNWALMSYGGTASASAWASYDAAYAPEKAFDGDPGTWWSAGHWYGAWLERDLGTTRRFHRVRLVLAPKAAGTATYAVDISDDGTDFSNLVPSTTVDVVKPTIVEEQFAPVEARYVRLTLDVSSDATHACEFEVYGFMTPLPPSVESPTDAWYVGGDSVVFTGAAAAGAVVRAYASGAQVGEAEAAPDGTWSMTVQGLQPGLNSVTFTATLGELTSDPSQSVKVYVDVPPSKDELRERITALEAENASLVDQNAALAEENAQLEAANAALSAENESLKSEVAVLSASIAAVDGAVTEFETDLQNEFDDPDFVLPGVAIEERVKALIDAARGLKHGMKLKLYRCLNSW